VCDFFDDCEPIIQNHQNYGISIKQYQILIELYDKFDQFMESHYPNFGKEFIDTPEWDHIVEMAKEVLKAFDYKSGAS